jgi:CubicO group peptidase (beta-lactamase class C family)
MPKIKTPIAATAFLAAALMLLSACGNSNGEAAASDTALKPDYYARYADDAAVSEAKLKSTIAPFFEDDTMAETRAVVILHGGILVAERYAPGYGPDTKLIGWSMSKTVTATLLGLMIADGKIAFNEPAPVPEWHSPGDERAKISLRQLLHMASGIDHSEGASPESGVALYQADTPQMLFLDGRDDVAAYAKNRILEAPPGKKFEYSSATSVILSDIMTRALTDSKDPAMRRDAMLEYARGRLFEPLGMASMTPEFDRSGTMLGGSMMHATARDWAKMGEFLRNDGSVRGSQLLPARWARFMRTSSTADAAYGAHLWLNKKRPEGRDPVLFPGRAPSDVFAMLGRSGQMVVVSPQQKLVIVRLGNTPEGEQGPLNDQMVKVISLFTKK